MIPKDLRARFGWRPGQEFEITVVDGQVVLEPPVVPMRAEMRGNTLVATTNEPMPVLTSDMVRDVLDQTRR